MRGELYQLIAIDKNGKEYVIELNNDNKNNKGFLEFIDSGTTYMANEQTLISYLMKKGKLDNPNVTFVIKYNNRGVRYLPVVYNDTGLREVALKWEEKNKAQFYAKCFIDIIDNDLCNSKLYNYMKELNEDIYSEISNGNYLDDKVIDEFRKYYEAYGIIKDDYSSKEEYKDKLAKSLNTYKRFRTAYIFHKMYSYSKFENKQTDNTYDIPEILKYIVPIEKESFNPETPEELKKAYEQYGMDGVWAVADSEEIHRNGYKFR